MELKKENAALKKENSKNALILENLKRIFTTGQIKKLTKGNKRVVWSEEDLSSAISLYAGGPKLYRYMYRKGYPFPAPSTLKNWSTQFQLQPGLIKAVMNLMKNLSYNKWEKLCVLSFDEMKVRSCYEYDKVNDVVMNPAEYVQVAMLRGLFKNWKQPIFYKYDQPMTEEILTEILIELHQIDFVVVALVSDLGSTNMQLRRKLKINENKPYFLHPADQSKQVFVFADSPHLIKLLRNHFIDNGFEINGKYVNVRPIDDLLRLEKSDLKINHKVTETHLNVSNAARQKVKYAVQLFSNSVSSCLRWCAMTGKLSSPNVLDCADFFKTVNDWFDLYNVHCTKEDLRSTKQAYGLKINEQNKVLDNMTDIINNMRVYGKSYLLPFQKGIITNNQALKMLFKYLEEKYNVSYLITSKLNQDVLERFFGIIRAKGGLHDHPSPIEFKYRLRSFLLGIKNNYCKCFPCVCATVTPLSALIIPTLCLSFVCYFIVCFKIIRILCSCLYIKIIININFNFNRTSRY